MYLALKLLHVISVIAFLGNITTGLFWHAHAARRRDPGILAHTMDGIIRSDRLFTVPGVIGIIVTGVLAARLGGFGLLSTGWIAWTLALFALSGVIFSARLAPMQRQLRQLAQDGGRSGQFDFAEYSALAKRWEFWGALALLTPLTGLVLMVLKPAL